MKEVTGLHDGALQLLDQGHERDVALSDTRA